MRFRVFHLLMAMVLVSGVSLWVMGCRQYLHHLSQFGDHPEMTRGELKVLAGIFLAWAGIVAIGVSYENHRAQEEAQSHAEANARDH
jgi:hypothetical protein